MSKLKKKLKKSRNTEFAERVDAAHDDPKIHSSPSVLAGVQAFLNRGVSRQNLRKPNLDDYDRTKD